MLCMYFSKDHNIRKKLDPVDLRALWKKAINQQVLLIRMEKENAKLKGSCV